MTTPIPDPLRQWHAQFIVGDSFARIMTEMDAAIATARQSYAPDQIIWLMQCLTLRQLFITIMSQTDEATLELLTKLGAVHDMLRIAALHPTPEQRLCRLLRFYRVAGRKTELIRRQIEHEVEQVDATDTSQYSYELIQFYLADEQFEAAMQIAYRSRFGSLCVPLLDIVKICIQTRQEARAQYYLLWLQDCHTLPAQYFHDAYDYPPPAVRWLLEWTQVAGDMAVWYHSTRRKAEAQVLFRRIEDRLELIKHIDAKRTVDKNPQKSAVYATKARFHLGMCYLKVGNVRQAAHWLNEYQDLTVIEIQLKTHDLPDHLARYRRPDRLIQLYKALNAAYHTSSLSVAFIRRLRVLDANAPLDALLAPFLNAEGEPADLVLPLLDELGQSALVDQTLTRQVQHWINTPPPNVNAYNQFVTLLLTLKRHYQLEDLLSLTNIPALAPNGLPAWLREVTYDTLFRHVATWIAFCLNAGNVEEARRTAERWINKPVPQQLSAAPLKEWHSAQFTLLCHAAMMVVGHHPAQARDWLAQAWQKLDTPFRPHHDDYFRLALTCLPLHDFPQLERLMQRFREFDATAASMAAYRLVEAAFTNNDLPTAQRLLVEMQAEQRTAIIPETLLEPKQILRAGLNHSAPVRISFTAANWWQYLPVRTSLHDFCTSILQHAGEFEAIQAGLCQQVLRACADVLDYVEQAQEPPT